MNLIDSSGWLEFFGGGPNAVSLAGPIRNIEDIVVPTICPYEVFKVVLRERSEDEALHAVAVMRRGKVVDLTPELALQAAKTSFDHKIPMAADSIVFATAQASRQPSGLKTNTSKGCHTLYFGEIVACYQTE